MQDTPTFKRSENPVWFGDVYATIPQGRLATRGKVKYAHEQYYLTRSHKYGNVCRDCAAVLDLAPGLLRHNNRGIVEYNAIRDNPNATAEEADSVPYRMQALRIMRKNLGDKGQDLDLDVLYAPKPTNPVLVAEWERKQKEIGTKIYDAMQERHKLPANQSKLRAAPVLYTQKAVNNPDVREPKLIQEAVRDLKKLTEGNTRVNWANPALKDILGEASEKYTHKDNYMQVDTTLQFDSKRYRVEHRNAVVRISGGQVSQIRDGKEVPYPAERLSAACRDRMRTAVNGMYFNSLIVQNYRPRTNLSAKTPHYGVMQTPTSADYVFDIYPCLMEGPSGRPKRAFDTQWAGDRYVAEHTGAAGSRYQWMSNSQPMPGNKQLTQYRQLRMSRLFITYSLHRPITSEEQGRYILEKISKACKALFGRDDQLYRMLKFGKKLESFQSQRIIGDTLSSASFNMIRKPRKDAAKVYFYASDEGSSYLYDTYDTHVESVDVDGGVEIGPKMHHPHFHILLTISHFTYVQFDYFMMNRMLQEMFTGTSPEFGEAFRLNQGNEDFYGDAENPYVDIKLYAQDDWQAVIAAYVRKSGVPSMMEVLANRGVVPPVGASI